MALRMLESPQDESVVRWGDQGDSFVVLEVRINSPLTMVDAGANRTAEREIHQAHFTKAFQT
jgi:hypothetical protein